MYSLPSTLASWYRVHPSDHGERDSGAEPEGRPPIPDFRSPIPGVPGRNQLKLISTVTSIRSPFCTGMGVSNPFRVN